MNAGGRSSWRAVTAAALAGCGGSRPTPGRAGTGWRPARQRQRPASPRTPTATPGPPSQPPAARKRGTRRPCSTCQTSEQVPFTGDLVTVNAQASAGRRHLALASAGQRDDQLRRRHLRLGQPACTGGARLRRPRGWHSAHSYRRAGLFTAEVTSARSAARPGLPDLNGVSAAVRVLPAAPAASASWPRCSRRTRCGSRTTGPGPASGTLASCSRCTTSPRRVAACSATPGLRLLGTRRQSAADDRARRGDRHLPLPGGRAAPGGAAAGRLRRVRAGVRGQPDRRAGQRAIGKACPAASRGPGHPARRARGQRGTAPQWRRAAATSGSPRSSPAASGSCSLDYSPS